MYFKRNIVFFEFHSPFLNFIETGSNSQTNSNLGLILWPIQSILFKTPYLLEYTSARSCFEVILIVIFGIKGQNQGHNVFVALFYI